MLERKVKAPHVLVYFKTFGLWLVTAVFAFFEILAVRDIVFNLYARIVAATEGGVVRAADYATATVLGQVSVYVMIVVTIAIVMGGFEYHRRHLGQLRSQNVLLWTLVFQLLILLVYLLL